MSSETIVFEKMKQIVDNESRPVSFNDFLSFSLNGLYHSYKHGHIRNIFSTLRKKGRIELAYKSSQAFYTIKGVKFNNSVTPTYITATPILSEKQKEVLEHYKIFKIDNQAIHDIRLFFPCKGLRSILLLCDRNLISCIDEKSNKDITLRDITLDDITLKTTVHNTDSVTVTVACSETPIPLDYLGVATLSGALSRVEERLQHIIDEYLKNRLDEDAVENISYSVPYHMSWIVKMWHFGYDSEPRFSGSSVEITWKEHLEVFRCYFKKNGIRTKQYSESKR